MLFNSTLFLEFFLVVVSVFFVLKAARAELLQKLWLLVASYAFYASWNPPFVLLLAFSTAVDFSAGLVLARSERPWVRRTWLGLSLLGNLGVLAFFKYANFFRENLVAVGVANWSVLHIVLPLGISFYTFQTLSYTIEVYRCRQDPCRSLLDFALYVSFFPQLVAGPIVRSQDFLPQLRQDGRRSQWEAGLRDIAVGLVKKVVLADTLGVFVDRIFAHPAGHSAPTLLLAAYSYAYQIYFDFSGYSDIAIGLAAVLGFSLRDNFNHPYLACNPAEFWRRWHISLSTWLRDYLYISLGGNRHGRWRTYRSLMITMLLGGLWHGAAWNFVLWGGYHGVILAVHRWFTRDQARGVGGSVLPLWLRQVATFHLVVFGWVLFRIEHLSDLGPYLRGLVSGGWKPMEWSYLAVAIVVIGAVTHVVGERFAWRAFFLRRAPELQALAYAAATAAVVLFGETSARFIYFQF